MPLAGSSKVTKAPATDGQPDAASVTTICGRKATSWALPARGVATESAATTATANAFTQILSTLMRNLGGTILWCFGPRMWAGSLAARVPELTRHPCHHPFEVADLADRAFVRAIIAVEHGRHFVFDDDRDYDDLLGILIAE